MFPTLTDLKNGAANDPSEDWLKAAEDASKLSIFYKRLANDQFNAYEKTVDRIMSNHNGHNARYRDSNTGRFVSMKNAVANDKIDRYEKTLDRIMSMHNNHDNARGRMDAENENRVIHDYNPDIPQSMYKDLPKYVMKGDKPIPKMEPSLGDKRSDVDLLRSINNDTTNILDVLHRISYTLDDYTDVDSLKGRERDLESGHRYNQEGIDAILAGLSGANLDGKIGTGKDKKEENKKSALMSLLADGEIGVAAAAAGAVGMVGMAGADALGRDKITSGGGNTGPKDAAKRADNIKRPGGADPGGNKLPDVFGTTKPGATGPLTTGTRFENGTLYLSDKDIRDIKKVVQTEWSHKGGEKQAEGIIDTILNRVASGKWGNSVKSVADYPKAFSAINGPYSNGRHSVDQYNEKIRADVNNIVDKYLKERAKGAESIVGDNLNYANLKFVSPNNKGWTSMLNGPSFGPDPYKHVHGTTPDLEKYRPGAFKVAIPGTAAHAQSMSDWVDPDKVKDPLDRQVIKALHNLKAGQNQVRFKDGNVAGTGSITINLPPSKSAPQQAPAPAAPKRRPPPAKSDWWHEWMKDYFGL
jgi:hypothetical protein